MPNNGRVYDISFWGPSNRYVRYSLLRADALAKVKRGASVSRTSFWAGAKVPGAHLGSSREPNGVLCEACESRRCQGHAA